MQTLKKIWIVSAFATALFLFALPSEAQISVECQGGPAFPMGDLNEYWGIGYTFGGTLLYEVTPFVSLGVNLAYSNMGLDTGRVKGNLGLEDWDISGGSASIFSACGEIRAHSGAMDMATLFAGAGFGLFHIGLTDIEISNGADDETASFDSEDQPGGYIHAGGTIPLTQMVRLGLKGQYTFYQMKNGDLMDMLTVSEGRSFFSFMAALVIGF
ncbi:MAG: hypothetical protein MIO92_08015 [Methanosarcinaceae archaeon]|jgi:hypothetical protein|nr:hypothetical protein [Methanosarcinaceae archaeon]